MARLNKTKLKQITTALDTATKASAHLVHAKGLKGGLAVKTVMLHAKILDANKALDDLQKCIDSHKRVNGNN